MAVHAAAHLPCTSRTASAHVAARTWQRPASGVYVDHTRPLSDAELVAVARAHVGAGLVVTGTLVLRELGLRWLPTSGDVHVLVPPVIDRPSSGVVTVTRTTGFEELETWTRYGERFASPDRAVVDAARSLADLRVVRGVVLGAVTDGWADVAGLRVALGRTQRNGSGLTRRAVADAERGCASPPEAELVDALVGRRVPFYVNPELWVGGVLLGRPDVWLLGRGRAGEVESREWHEDDEQVESTYDRHERLVAAGVGVTHLAVRRIRHDPGAAASYLLSRPAVQERAGLRIVPRGPLLR